MKAIRSGGLTLVTMLLCSQAYAEPPATFRVALNIAPQPLADALTTLAQQTGIQILVNTDDVPATHTAPRIVGTFTPEAALKQLVANTDLKYEFINDRTARVSRAESAKDLQRKTSATDIGVRNHPLVLAQGPDVTRKTSATSDPREMSSDSDDASFDRRQAIEEIVVTAQKRQERLIDTPQSVSVLSSDYLTKLGATQFRDFANTVPGLTFTTAGAGFTQVSLRGVTSGSPDVSATVGIYVDETPYGSSSAFTNGARLTLDAGLFDLERIEVLRGPQGTLYGASTMGGLLKYVSKRPDATHFGVDAQTGVSSTRDGGVSYNGSIAVNAPIVAKAALRASGFYTRDGGYIDSQAFGEDINRSDTYGGRLDLLLTPTNALSVRLVGFAQNISRNGEATANYTIASEPLTDSLTQDRALPEPFDQHFRLVSGTVTYDLGGATLTSISSYQTIGTVFDFDISPVFVPFLSTPARPFSAIGLPGDTNTDRFTQELRLSADGSRPIEWVIGGFYNHESTDYVEGFSLRDAAGQPEVNDLYTLQLPSRFAEYAAFGDLTWRLTEKFDVTGGTRYAHNEQKFTSTLSGIFGSSSETTRSNEDVSTYLANARYRFSDRATGYLRYATGYRPGGPNLAANDPVTGLPLAPPTFEADRLKSYEAGFKAETADGRFGLDVASYYIDWSNIQLFAFRGGFAVRLNAPGGASIRGAELALTARPTRAFTMTGAFAYQDAKLSEADADLGGAEGERLPNVPRFTAAVNADYELPVENWRPTIGATVRHVTDRTADFGSGAYRLPEYTMVDLRTGFMLGQADLQLYVHNLFDERAQLSADTGFGIRTAISQPRTIGIVATTRF